MTITVQRQPRILIFGAGVIGSTYAVKFIQAGIDVTMLARANRFKTLNEHGLQYMDKGNLKSVKVHVIEKLFNDDIYDFIFVPVRYDQSEAALLALKDNRSPNIVTMTNTSSGYSSWLNIIGDRLLPGFPSAGGQIVDGLLHSQFGPRIIQATMFGEINGRKTERTAALARLFRMANIPYTIAKDMTGFQITHAVLQIAMINQLYVDGKRMDQAEAQSKKTAHQMTTSLKTYLKALKRSGVQLSPAMFGWALIVPDSILDFVFLKLLGTKLVGEVLFTDYADNAYGEIELLSKDFSLWLKDQGVIL
ncbi:ketopantoate reductase family protein [Paenibacillus sp. JDR-2]|uniref:ketopantoate reductase family protein n=1 Tax=Paenibacillus sp. (strain JDR-2) TaxID=324057 RepID=UPI000166ADD7|nr:2-dehydropantoate 2-reductase N-terminal domain-containing protein [Paenibacillus sp. JDR-2]ACT04795.1 Ketopantoate reductase ApbA/PanE domain protein [Paenibacillus sp. JDR-2]